MHHIEKKRRVEILKTEMPTFVDILFFNLHAKNLCKIKCPPTTLKVLE
jgi:hypothetical protein